MEISNTWVPLLLKSILIFVALILIMTLTTSCRTKPTHTVSHVAAQDRDGRSAVVITRHATYLDAVTLTGEQGKITDLSSRILRLDLDRSGSGAYDEAGGVDIGFDATPIDGGLIGQDLYYVRKKSTGYVMYKQMGTVSSHAPQEIFLGRALPVFYESGNVAVIVDDMAVRLIDLATGEFAEIPQQRRALIEGAGKLAINLKFLQSICIANGVVWLAHTRSEDEDSTTSLILTDVGDRARSPLTVVLRKSYVYAKVKMIPSASGEVIINVYGIAKGSRFSFESFRFLSKKSEVITVEPFFSQELNHGRVGSLLIKDWD